MANSKSGDIIGSRILSELKAVSGNEEFNIYGYGGDKLKAAGMNHGIEFDMENCADKTYYSYRKARNYSEAAYAFKWSRLNMPNIEYITKANNLFDELKRIELPKKLSQVRPSVVLNIDNELLSFNMMAEFKSKTFLILKDSFDRALQQVDQ